MHPRTGGPPDRALWTVTSPNCAGTGTLQVSAEQAHGGAHSLRVDGGGGYCDHVFIAHTAAFTGLTAQVHGRFFVRLEAPLGQGHTTFVTLRDTADDTKDLRMGGQSEILMWNRESDDATLPSLSPAGHPGRRRRDRRSARRWRADRGCRSTVAQQARLEACPRGHQVRLGELRRSDDGPVLRRHRARRRPDRLRLTPAMDLW